MQADPRSFSIGIEIEFTGLNRFSAASIVAEFFDSQATYIGGAYDTYEVKDSSQRVWKIVRDSSVRAEVKVNYRKELACEEYQCELVSPVLAYQDIKLIQNVVRDLRVRGGAFTNWSTGVHVHIGSSLFNPRNLRVLCNILYAKQSLLETALRTKIERKSYCNFLSSEFIYVLNKRKPKTFDDFADIWYDQTVNGRHSSTGRNYRYHPTRYQILNLHNLLMGKYEAIEFRLFDGTLHAGRIKAFIQLSLLITAQAINQKKATNRITKTTNPKYSFRVWLLKMGAIGDEFRTMRYHLLKEADGNSAHRNDPRHIPSVQETETTLEVE